MEDEPQDAETIKQLLESMDVVEYDPRVVEQLMEFMYRYTAEVLQDAEAISSRCGVPPGEVAAQDVTLAIQARGPHSFVPPPPQRLLLQLAQLRNTAPLPELRQRHGLRIPPEAECLLNPNIQLQPTKEGPAVAVQPIDSGAKQARETSAAPHGVQQKHAMKIAAPAEGDGWQKPPAEAQPWPGSSGQPRQDDFDMEEL